MSGEFKQIMDWIDANPGAAVKLAGAVATSYAATLAAGWGIASYLNKREIDDYKRKIDTLTSDHQRDVDRLARQAENGKLIDEEFPAIGDLEPAEVPLGLPNPEDHGDFNIVLAQSLSQKLWTVERSTLKEIFSEWFGSSLTEDPHLSSGYKLVSGDETAPCLLWRGASEVMIDDDPVMKRMYPFIIVRTIPHDAGADPTTDELLNFFDWLRMWDEAMPNAKFEIVKMHRTRNKAYLRGHFKFTGLTITENRLKLPRRCDQYFLMRQLFVVTSGASTTIIATGLPNHELTADPYYQPLNEWWKALRLIGQRHA